MSTLKIGICGWGNVATGLYKIAKNNIESIKKQGNLDIEIVVIGARRDNPNCKPENVIAPRAAPNDISIKLASFIFPRTPRPNASGFKNAEIATKTAAKPTRL